MNGSDIFHVGKGSNNLGLGISSLRLHVIQSYKFRLLFTFTEQLHSLRSRPSIMTDYTTEEAWHSLSDKYNVYTKTWLARASLPVKSFGPSTDSILDYSRKTKPQLSFSSSMDFPTTSIAITRFSRLSLLVAFVFTRSIKEDGAAQSIYPRSVV